MYSFVLEELIIRPLVLSNNGINDLFTKTIRIETVNDFFKIMALLMIFHDIEEYDDLLNQDDLADWVSWLRYPSPQYWTSHPILERELGPVIAIVIFDVDVVLIVDQQSPSCFVLHYDRWAPCSVTSTR